MVAKNFFSVMCHDTQNAVVPIMISAKIGTPAREIVSTMDSAATPMATVESTRSSLGSDDVAAATKMGETRHKYMDRLFG